MVASESVVLLNEEGVPIGTGLKDAVHHEATPLHLGFSCYLFDSAGRLLITRRALTKRSWPGVWTNSFCGHPAPGEDLPAAVRRHAHDELSVRIDEPRAILPDFRYRAVDAHGVVENEVCPVFMATTLGSVAPNPREVMDFACVWPADLVRTVATTPQVLSPWAVLQIPRIAGIIGGIGEPR